LKELDKLPEKYQKAAGQAIKDARKAAKTRKFNEFFGPQIRHKQFDWRPYADKISPYLNPPVTPFGPGDEMFDAIKKQMKEMQQRLDKLEKWQKKKFDSDKSDEPESQQQKDSLPRDKENEKLT